MLSEVLETKTNKILNPNFWNEVPEDIYNIDDKDDQWSNYHDIHRDDEYSKDILSQNGMYLGVLNHDKTELIDYGILEDNPDSNSIEVEDDLDNHLYH